ncbi:MAG: metallophosphoesterase [Pseudomonadota bacterium]
MFFLMALSVLLAAQLIGLSVAWRKFRGRPRLRLAAGLFFLAGNLPWLFFWRSLDNPELPTSWATALLIRPFATWQTGVLLWLAVAAASAAAVFFLWRVPRAAWRLIKGKKEAGPPQPEVNSDRRDFLVVSGRAASWAMALTFAGYGLARAGRSPRVVRHEAVLPNLPRELRGLRIAHLSDLHVGLWTSADDVAQALDLTRSLRPDLVVMTGDLVDHNPAFAEALMRHLNLLADTPLGVYGVIGNHDVYTGAGQVTAALEKGGLVMLRNRAHSFREEGLPLSLVGLDDPGRQWAGSAGPLPLDQAMSRVPGGDVPILLYHRPTVFDQAAAAGVPLTLCGHTHGGQFALPGGPNLADISYEFTHGLYSRPGGLIHVSAGLGSVGLPFRIGVPPEIALITLAAG